MVAPLAPTPPHWNYFLALEDDVLKLARYIEPARQNFGAYSLELSRILFAAASEVEVVSQQLYSARGGKAKKPHAPDWMGEVLSAFPLIVGTVIDLPRFGLSLVPWAGSEAKSPPSWWGAYNNVKHYRHSNYSQASLEHALNAVGALFALLLYFYGEDAHHGRLFPNPTTFFVGHPFTVDRPAWGPDVNLYQLIGPASMS
ncbi:hypothetical protein [Hydrogenophaga sp. T2]|uniref:hypothetical protein n=1 Tax=Hydrogenophaga sp. T2 TaxID=3132823 RepID=UPI003CF33492